MKSGCLVAVWVLALSLSSSAQPSDAAGTPIIRAVVNGASFGIVNGDPTLAPNTLSGSAVAPGGMVTLFGSNLASGSESAAVLPLPVKLQDASVTFNGIPAPLFFVSETQINAQVPFEAVPGTALVQVRRGDAGSASFIVQIAPASPGIFTLNQQGTGTGVVVHGYNFRLVSDSAPAWSGETIAIFCTGLGLLQAPLASGAAAGSLMWTAAQPLVDIGGIPAEVLYSGMTPHFAGLYQVNVRVPAGVTTGPRSVQIIVDRVASNAVTIAVRQQ